MFPAGLFLAGAEQRLAVGVADMRLVPGVAVGLGYRGQAEAQETRWKPPASGCSNSYRRCCRLLLRLASPAPIPLEWREIVSHLGRIS